MAKTLTMYCMNNLFRTKGGVGVKNKAKLLEVKVRFYGNSWTGASSVAAKSRGISMRPCNAEKGIRIILPMKAYITPARDSNYKILDEEDVSYFKSILGTSLQYGGDLHRYNQDYLKKVNGKSKLVLLPRTTQEVSAILKYCNEKKISVIPQGGNTSLVAGSVPLHDEVVINLSKMNKIHSFNESTGVLKCGSGCILETLDSWLSEKGHMTPIDLGARGSCQIGGNVATNAGGIHYLRYGSLRSNVLSLEVVLPNGTILETNRPLYKDNTGFDLKQLFIGSEGSIGIITSVTLTTPKKPKYKSLGVLAVNSYEKIVEIYSRVRTHVGETVSAFEFYDKESVIMSEKRAGYSPLITNASQQPYDFYVMIELSSVSSDAQDDKLGSFLESLVDDNVIEDAIIAQDMSQQREFWERRESISEISGKGGYVYKYDIGMNIENVYHVVEAIRDYYSSLNMYKCGPDSLIKYIVGYGHVGDGNLHINISTEDVWQQKMENTVYPFLYDFIDKNGGSVSAEHGLGYNKAPYILYTKSLDSVKIMRSIKNLFDPNNIMSPYKFLLPESQLLVPSSSKI